MFRKTGQLTNKQLSQLVIVGRPDCLISDLVVRNSRWWFRLERQVVSFSNYGYSAGPWRHSGLIEITVKSLQAVDDPALKDVAHRWLLDLIELLRLTEDHSQLAQTESFAQRLNAAWRNAGALREKSEELHQAKLELNSLWQSLSENESEEKMLNALAIADAKLARFRDAKKIVDELVGEIDMPALPEN